ncbi:MAG: proline--tRNA ligase [Candidatus Woesearchaeota archaeon]|nr:MAG: proline--tRNA ligase [Candidatus Woesearchaeota archaeon]
MAERKTTIGIETKKEDNISEWYTQVMQKADLADYTSVSGCLVFKPRSYAIWETIVAQTDLRFKQAGIQNAYFPLFIPESLFQKEAAHVEGFSPEVAWVTHAGDTKLNERLAVRPTSETIMYESYSKWIRSWRDLPLRLNQWCNVVRWEFKHPVPFLRTREFLWNEGHTAFATKKQAEDEGPEIISIYNEICENLLALPSVIGRKSEKEKFAGAEYTISLEFFLPSGKAIQGPDFHHDGQNFAKAFDIKFKDQNGNDEYAWQNTFAITTRVIGIMIMMHGDNKGLVLPPFVAPTQIGIVPILGKGDDVLAKAKEIEESLRSAYKVQLDEREEYSPGYKFNEMELQGVPLRIEIGPKDLAANSVVLVRRDTGEKTTVALDKLASTIEEELTAMHHRLFEKAKTFLEENIVSVDNYDEFKKAIADKKLVKARYCNDKTSDCEEIIKADTVGAKPLNIPEQEPSDGVCVHCGKPAKEYAYFGKAY